MNAQAMDRAIEALARKQHGAFHRRQAIDIGFSARMIQRRRAAGEWLTLARGVYALNGHPFDWLRQVKAAELSVAGAVVSHRTAAVIHEIPGFRAGRIELTAPLGGRHDSALAVVHRAGQVPEVVRNGVAVTSAARTVVDLAGSLDEWRLGRALDDVVVGRLATVDEIGAALAVVAPGHARGAGTLKRLIDERRDGFVPSTSQLEAELDLVLRDPRLPAAEREAAFPWWPEAPYRVDALIRRWRRIIEVDGRRWHTRVADFQRDRARDHLAQRHGYEVTRFAYWQVVGSRSYVVDTLLAIGRAHDARFVGERAS